MDDTMLEFNEEALVAVAAKAIERKSGARGLRAILEETMMDIMYEIPSSKDIEKVIITKETVNEKKPPELIYNVNRRSLRASGIKKPRGNRESVS
jgi:ATP-dependent Clp protease ATP-binding subunit ClpX